MKALILTEGGRKIGFGHITRCEALRSALRANGFRTMLVVNGDSSVKRQFKGKIDYVLNWTEQRTRLEKLLNGVRILIIDSYLAPPSFYKKISRKIPLPVYIDDYRRLSYPKGIVLNGGIGTEKLSYSRVSGVSHLLGIRYAPLRKEFWHVSRHPIRAMVQNILMTFGGIDRFYLVQTLLRYLRNKCPNFCFHVLVPPKRRAFYQKAFRDIRSVKFYSGVGPVRMRNLMLRCDIAITGGGQTLNELSRCGLPSVGICLADNQYHHLNEWQKHGLVSIAGRVTMPNIEARVYKKIRALTYRKRRRIAKLASMVIDGRGPIRVAQILKQRVKGVEK